jgi:hypothetical protein
MASRIIALAIALGPTMTAGRRWQRWRSCVHQRELRADGTFERTRRCADLGTFGGGYTEANVPSHGITMLRMAP